jgi:diguanylate cyclase (GGDEF)-like protein
MKAHLLLIDDGEARSNELLELLERLGYGVTLSSSGARGVRLACTISPDLVLVGAVLADMDGFAACRWLKMNAVTRDVPVIMLTEHAAVAHRVEGLSAGADACLTQPFEVEELEARIFATLRMKTAHTQLRDRNQQLESMVHRAEALASTDALTGLPNRRRFTDALKREFAVTKRYRNTLTCLLLDIDHFKAINDRFGHDAGDRVLKEVAMRIARSVREVDLAARYGGEEFGVLLPHTNKGDARVVADRLLNNVRRQEFSVGSESLTITISIGCADSSDPSSKNAEDLTKAADIALYEAKRSGRDRVVTYPTSGNAPNLTQQNSPPPPGMPITASPTPEIEEPRTVDSIKPPP